MNPLKQYCPSDHGSEDRVSNQLSDQDSLVPMRDDECLLQPTWKFWLFKGAGAADWNEGLKELFCIKSIKNLASLLHAIKNLSRLTYDISYLFFRTGVSPRFHDKANIDGGILSFVVPKEKRYCPSIGGLDRTFEELLMIVLGQRFEDANSQLNGLSAVQRPNGSYKVSVWIRDASDTRSIHYIRNEIAYVLGLDGGKFTSHADKQMKPKEERQPKSVAAAVDLPKHDVAVPKPATKSSMKAAMDLPPAAPVAQENASSSDYPLSHQWTFWIWKSDLGAKKWEDNLKEQFSHITSIKDYATLMSRIEVPSKLRPSLDYYFFKAGIQPMWEDSTNRKGGAVIVNIMRVDGPSRLDRLFKWLLEAILGNQLGSEAAAEINGLVMANRARHYRLCIWIRDAKKSEVIEVIRKRVRSCCELFETDLVYFEPHRKAVERSVKRAEAERDNAGGADQ